MYQRINSRPSNIDSPGVREENEQALTTAFMQYLSGSGVFADWKDDRRNWKGNDPIAVWEAFKTEEISELCKFAKTLLRIVVNQAGCERLFSDVGNTQGDRRTRIAVQKLEKITKVLLSFCIKTTHLIYHYVPRSDPASKPHTLDRN